MITINFNDFTGAFEIKVHDSNSRVTSIFDYIVTTLRDYHCSARKGGVWFTYSPFIIFPIYNDLSSIEEVVFSEEDQQLAKDLMFPTDTSFKKYKMRFNNEFFTKHPPILGKPPYENFQMDTIRFLTGKNRGVASITMGGGKTYIMCGVIANLLYNNRIDKVMWVCRPEGLIETKMKILFFLGDYFTEDDIAIVTTDNREIEDYFDKKIILTSYNTFRITSKYYYDLKTKKPKKRKVKEGEEPKEEKKKKTVFKPRKGIIDFSKWCAPERMVQILDEGQAIKNDSQQTNAFLIHRDAYAFRYILSGTIGYKVEDYFYPLKYLVPESLPSHSEWEKYIFKPHETLRYKYDVRVEALSHFKERVIDSVQIVFGEGCLDLPPFQQKEVYLPMSPKMRKMYKTFIEDAIEELNTKVTDEEQTRLLKTSFAYYTLFTSDPSLLNEKFNFDWDFKENPKIEVVESLLDKYINEENRKVIIWSNHPIVINNLGKILNKYHPIIIHGDEKSSMKKDERHSEVQDFRKNPKKNLLITSYVLNSSIDIPEATRTIYWDLIADNDKFNQSKKRHHRMGQKETTITHYLMFDQSVDVYIWNEILEAKENVRRVMTSLGKLDIEFCKRLFNSKAQFKPN